MDITTWLPTIIATGALGMIFFSMRGHKKELSKKVDGCMPKTEHELLCENAALKIKDHISHEITDLKDVLFKELRNINQLIDGK